MALHDEDGLTCWIYSNRWMMRNEFANRPRYFETNEPKRFAYLVDGFYQGSHLKPHYDEYMAFISPHYQQLFKSFCVNHLLRIMIMWLQNPQHYHYNLKGTIASGLLQFREMLRNKILGLKYNFKNFEPAMIPSIVEKKISLKHILNYADRFLDALLPEAEKLLPKHLAHKLKHGME